MQYSTVQYSTVQCSTVQYSTVQYSTVQCSTVQCSTVQCSTVQYSTVQYSTVQYSTVQYSTVQYSTVQCITAQQSTVTLPGSLRTRHLNPTQSTRYRFHPCSGPVVDHTLLHLAQLCWQTITVTITERSSFALFSELSEASELA